MAKELVTNEYVDIRAQLHNQWLVDSSKLWVARRMRLPYPDIPPYPTETDIIERAHKLLDFVGLDSNDITVDAEGSIVEENISVQSAAQTNEWESIHCAIEDSNLVATSANVEQEIADSSKKSKTLLGSIFSKLEEMKNSF